MTSSQRNDWFQQPANPDPNNDLGYDISPWDVVPVENGESDHRLLLPTDEAMLRDDAFIIVPDWMVYSLDEHR